MYRQSVSSKAILAMGLVIGALFASQVKAEPAGSLTHLPGIDCVNSNLDFGAVYSDAVVKHSFVLTNVGERVIKILGVRTSCGCSTAKAVTNSIAPGQSTDVEVVINFKGRRGRQSKSIYVETDDPVSRIVHLSFTGTVFVPIEAQPEGVHLGTVGEEGSLEREVLLTAVSTNVFQVLSAKSASSQVSVTVEPREAGKQYLIKIIDKGPRKRGSFMTSVEVTTDHPQMRVVSIPVAGFVAGDIVSSPNNLVLAPSAGNASNTVWVNLWSPSGKSFSITRLELPGEGMTNSIATLKPSRYRLEFKTWGPLSGLDGKVVRIETDLASMKEILLPVKVLAQP